MTKRPLVLVTGAGGYIGSVLVPRLLANGFQVRALDRFYFGKDTLASCLSNPDLTLIQKDVRQLADSDFEGVSVVIDLAALSNDPLGELNKDLTRAVNLDSRLRNASLAKAAGVQLYLLSSSCSVYGYSDKDELLEGDTLNPLTTYAECNSQAEEGLLDLSGSSFAVVNIRNGTVFGASPRMRFDLIVNLMTLHAVTKSMITVLGGGAQRRPLIHVRDVVSAFLRLLEMDRQTIAGKTFNLSQGNYSALEVAYLVRETLPFKVDLNIAPDDSDKRSYSVSTDKLLRELAFRPEVSVEEGVMEIYEGLKTGALKATARTNTLNWYKNLMEAESLVKSLSIDGQLF